MEVIFTIFYLSGIIKSFLIFYNIPFPIDFTFLASFLLLLALIIEFKNEKISVSFNKNILLSFVFLILFYLWMLLSLIWTPSESYSYKKVILFIPNIIGFGFPLLCKRFDIAKFFRIVSITLIFVSIWFLKIYLDYLDDGYSKKTYYEPFLGLYLSCASFMGLNILVILGAKKKVFKNLFVSSFVVTLTIILLFLLGARGPFIFVLLLLIPLFIIKYIYSYYYNKVLLSDFKKALYSGLTVLLFFVFFLIFEKEVKVLLDRSVFRISLLMPSSDSETSSVPTTSNTTKSSSINTSVDTRIDQLKFSMDLIKNNKFESIYGFGVGSFGILYLQKDFRAYPHNIFLEIWVELGLIGLILFLIFLYFVFSKNLNGTNYINLLVLVYIILNVLKSSSYVDIRVFFAVFAMYMLSSNDKSLNKVAN